MKSEMSRKSDMFHPYTLVIHPDFKELGDFILSLPERFEKTEGIVIHKGRNELRKMEYGGREYVVKSFTARISLIALCTVFSVHPKRSVLTIMPNCILR